jgi:iron complex transport system substrate-binding protein
MRRGFFLFLLLPALLWAGGPRRVVSQTVGTDDLLMAIAEPAQIAALSHLARDVRYSPSTQDAKRFPCLTNGEAEDILRFHPDLVLVASYTQAETVKLLRRAKVQVMLIDHFDSLEDLYANARQIGKALGREARTEELIRQWQTRVAALAKRLRGVKPARVLAVGFYPFTAGSGTSFQDICDHAGALNVAAEAGLKGHAPTPTERVLTWNVEVLVAPAEPGLDLKARLLELAPYRFMPALKQGHLVQLPGALMAATSQARIDAYEWLARALHPQRFQ